MVYHGKTDQVVPYFNQLHYHVPAGESVADWLIDISSGRLEPDCQIAKCRKSEYHARQRTSRGYKMSQEVIDAGASAEAEECDPCKLYLDDKEECDPCNLYADKDENDNESHMTPDDDVPLVHHHTDLSEVDTDENLDIAPKKATGGNSGNTGTTATASDDDGNLSHTAALLLNIGETPASVEVSPSSARNFRDDIEAPGPTLLVEESAPFHSNNKPENNSSSLLAPTRQPSMSSTIDYQHQHEGGVTDVDVVGGRGVTSGKAIQAAVEAKQRRDWLYCKWNKFYSQLPKDKKKNYEPPLPYALPVTVTKPSFLYQLKQQTYRIFTVRSFVLLSLVC